MNADDLQVVRELRDMLAMPDAKPLALVEQVRALTNHVLDQHELIRELLGYDDLSADAVAPHHLQQRAAQLQKGPHSGPHPARRLGVLTHELPAIHGLLIESIQITHADVLAFERIHTDKQTGVVSREFVHKPTGRRYSMAIASVEEGRRS